MAKRYVSYWPAARAGARGLVAAMAMTGMRTATANVGLMERSPPEALVERHAPRRIQQLSEGGRTAVTELAHWSYGAAGGAMFGLLPTRVRAWQWTGPLYGLAVWLSFEAGIAPLVGVQRPKQSRAIGRAVVALDHVLYGVVVAGRLAPEPEVLTREGRGRARRGD